MNALAFLAAFLPVPVTAAPAAVAATPVEAVAAVQAAPARAFVRIPAGTHVPFYGDGRADPIAAFDLDGQPVSEQDYLDFVRANPEWRRGRVKAAFADDGYLRQWSAPLSPADLAAPVTGVSWFAARAFCGWVGGRLPTVAEWEYVASADADRRDATLDDKYRARILEMFTRPRPAQLPAVGSGELNWYGVRDMHGVVREWVLDFNSVMIADDSRATGGNDGALYCAAAASNARDASDYAAFLRYSYRASLNGRSTHGNLGFRCARSIP